MFAEIASCDTIPAKLTILSTQYDEPGSSSADSNFLLTMNPASHVFCSTLCSIYSLVRLIQCSLIVQLTKGGTFTKRSFLSKFKKRKRSLEGYNITYINMKTEDIKIFALNCSTDLLKAYIIAHSNKYVYKAVVCALVHCYIGPM